MAEKGKGVMQYQGFIDLNYDPTDDDLVCEFYLEPVKGLTFEDAAQRVAAESSIGTWTDIWTLDKQLFNRLAPHIFFIDKKKGLFKVAYPKELFEEHNISQIMSSVAGNVFGMSDVINLRLEDIDFPRSFIKHYKGPHYGIDGVRKLLGVKHRPLMGTIIKPKLGLSEVKHLSLIHISEPTRPY